jgi:hypothetical protein
MKTRVISGIGALVLATLATTACDSGDASKSWSEFATCIAGPAAASPVLERAQKLRQYQLGNPVGTAATADGWPKRCSAPADTLFATLDKSGKTSLLRRKLSSRLGCNEQKGSCKIPADGSLLSISTEIWETAQAAGLKLEAVQGAKAPEAASAPVVDSKSWKSFSAKPMKIAGPTLTSDGRAIVVLKTAEGRVRPTGCEFSADFAKVRCLENAKIPELPPQSIDAVADSKGVYAAGLTDEGLVAYNLETGETSPVGGRAGRLVREGVVVERAQKQDIATAGAEKMPGLPKPGMKMPKAAPADDGYVARELKQNKASKDIPLKIQPVGEPISIGNQIVFLTPTNAGTNLSVVSVSNGRASAPRTLEGAFSGSFHTCRNGDDLAVATFGGRKDQGRATATAGEGKTAFTVTLFRNGNWSKPAEATLPFERGTESELICTANGASIAWAQKSEGGATVGRIDCTADGCKSNEAKLAGIDSTYFWAVAPLGEKTFLLYRSTLGETRLRVGGLAELASAKDTILFDTPDFGGPTTGELVPVITNTAALLVFRGEQPVALRIGADGAPSVVSL